MTLSQWIKKYCTDNNITLPSGISNDSSALDFLMLSTIKFTKLLTDTFEANVSSTTATSVTSKNVKRCDGKLYVVFIEDVEGKASGKFYKSVSLVTPYPSSSYARLCIGFNSSNTQQASTNNGLYLNSITTNEDTVSLNIYGKYSSTYGSINGTYKITAYAVDF